ncbi:alpha/beta hydrolase [Rapidithrix thailandica]|uniref:Alpha/beta hydrolase n=1 Tax=Rapidithrix thailandica TaxID=413964 RepID=A0AAW9SEX0_9BACT
MKKITLCIAMALFLANVAMAQKTLNHQTPKGTITMENLLKYRSEFDNLGKIYPASKKVRQEKVLLHEITCYWFRPVQPIQDKIAIYLHGGSFALGSINSHRALVSNMAEQLNMSILFVEYGLAPENPYPQGILDAKQVYGSIQKSYSDKEIILIGDSAGGGIAISLLDELKNTGFPAPEKLVLISPWVDIACSHPSITGNASIDPILSRDELLKFTNLYAASEGVARANPLRVVHNISFPSTLIMAGTNEILLDDSKVLYQALKEKKAAVKLHIYEEQTHVWLLTDFSSDAALKSIEDLKAFVLSK